MQKLCRLCELIPLASAMILSGGHSLAQLATMIQINFPQEKDPIVLNGKSGGNVSSRCGYRSTTANHVMQITQPLPYLRLTVESQDKPTLLVDGPGGRFCVLTDNYTHDRPELSGYWPAGKYAIYIGESSKQQGNYMLTISQQKK
jgi:hypothetical protein